MWHVPIPTSLREPYFLKASPCLDLHATGALSQFVLLRASESGASSSQLEIGGMEIFEHDTMSWIPFTASLHDQLYEYVGSIRHNEAIPEPEKPEVRSVVATAEFFRSYLREHVKGSREHVDNYILLSMVVANHNIDSLVDKADEDESTARTVKMMRKSIEVGDTRTTTFTRLTAHKAKSRIGWAAGSRIDAETVMLQVEARNGDFLVATRSHALIRRGGRCGKAQRTSKFQEALGLLRGKEEHSELDDDLISRLLTILGVAAPSEEDEVSTEAEAPVCILYKASHPLDRMSQLNEETQEKVAASKEKTPTVVHNAARLCDENGAAFKYAKSVHLGWFEGLPSRLNVITGSRRYLNVAQLETSSSK